MEGLFWVPWHVTETREHQGGGAGLGLELEHAALLKCRPSGQVGVPGTGRLDKVGRAHAGHVGVERDVLPRADHGGVVQDKPRRFVGRCPAEQGAGRDRCRDIALGD